LSWRGRFQEAFEVGGRGLSALGDRVTAERADLLARRGLAISAAGDYVVGGGMIAEAMEIAAELSDRVLANVMSPLAIHHYFYGQYREAVEVGRQAFDLLRSQRMLWEAANVLGFLQWCQLSIGQVAEALELHQELAPLAHKLGHHGALNIDLNTMIPVHLAAGDLDAAENEAQQGLELCLASGMPWYRHSHVSQACVAFARGEWDRAVDLGRQAGEYDFPWLYAAAEPAALMMFLAYAGQIEEAQQLANRLRDEMPVPGAVSGGGSWRAAQYAVEGFIAMEELDQAAELCPVMEASIDEIGWVIGVNGRSIRLLAALAAAAGGMWERAEAHFKGARADAQGLGPRSMADADYFEAWALLRRRMNGDEQSAAALLTNAITGYARIGMPRHVELAQKLTEQIGSESGQRRGRSKP
jgi:tetratricopeptide (TPR) repeat protein